jgi:hypothetical protein
MAESPELSAAAAQANTALTHYLLRAAVHSARTQQLFEQVIGCVARKQLDPDMLRDALTQALHARGADFVTKAAALNARFFATLATSSVLPAADIAPPPFEPANPIGWLEELALYAVERHTRAVVPDRQSMAVFLKQGVPEHLGHVSQSWFALHGELEMLRADFMEEYLHDVLTKVRPIGFHAEVLDLAAPLGQLSSTELILTNDRDERISICCAVGDIRRADGVGPAFRPEISVSPAELLLDTDADAAVRLSLHLDETIYEGNAPYIGALHIRRDGQPHSDVPLRIIARPRELR